MYDGMPHSLWARWYHSRIMLTLTVTVTVVEGAEVVEWSGNARYALLDLF